MVRSICKTPSMVISRVVTGNPQIRQNSSRGIQSYTARTSIHTDAEKGAFGGSSSELKDAILLHAAIEEPVDAKAKELVEHLLISGVDPNVKKECGCTALHHVVNSTGRPRFTQHHVDIVKILLERGADVKDINRHGNTPLRTALQTREIEKPSDNSSLRYILSILEENEATPRSRPITDDNSGLLGYGVESGDL